jgi:SAM-dependent methyltransferase
MQRAWDRALSIIPLWQRVRTHPRFRAAVGFEETLWTRRVSEVETRRLVAALNPSQLSALEISGNRWSGTTFRAYRQVDFPAFDVCANVLPERFDLIIAEHVFEHIRWPHRAATNVRRMLVPGGHFLIVTPFLYKVHPNPLDCTRWTEQGLRFFLEDAGFGSDRIVTGSWGNRACIEATFRREYRLFNHYLHSVRHEPDHPIVVWALAASPVDAPPAAP